MTYDEILVFVFLILDHDRDGFISTTDIINIINACGENPLVLRDCGLVLKKFKPKGTSFGVEEICDTTVSQFFLQYPQTLVKYRLNNNKAGS